MKTPSFTSTVLLSKEFERFAEKECKDNSPLYYQLSKQVSRDEELLRLCFFVKDGQPVPNAFLAAVHFLILKNKQAPLAQYYPSVTGRKTEAIPFDMFKEFVQQHEKEMVHLMRQRIVQTNVITRCNYLLPVFSNIFALEDKPATIIDIGSSAGLTLNFDRYEYYYNDEKVYGDSRVKLHCLIKGIGTILVKPFKNPIRKIGIDQHVIDLANADDHTWLEALIWPDQTERLSMLHEALNEPHLSDIKLIQGSTIADFKKLVEPIDPSDVLILYATHVLYQFTDELRIEFYNFLDGVGQIRDFYFLSADATEAVRLKHGVNNTAVVLTTYKNKQKDETLLAETNGHGNWIKWVSDWPRR